MASISLSAAVPRYCTHFYSTTSVVQVSSNHLRCGRATAMCRARTSTVDVATPVAMPSFLPKEVLQLQEPAARDMARQMCRIPIEVPNLPSANGKRCTVNTAFVGPSQADLSTYPADTPAIVLIHAFDSSCLEFRRLYPRIAQHAPTFAVDLIGRGFTDHSIFDSDPLLPLGPATKRAHLLAFLQQVVGTRPVVLVGTSLGGAVALDFAIHHAEHVSKLVLVNAQAFVDGIGPLATLPKPLAALGVNILKSRLLRSMATQMIFFNKQQYATEDAVNVGRLHTLQPGWLEAVVAFMQSGGYNISKRIKEVQTQALVLWGRHDEVLERSSAQKFIDALPNHEFVWIEDSGHMPHLEQPEAVAAELLRFVAAPVTAK